MAIHCEKKKRNKYRFKKAVQINGQPFINGSIISDDTGAHGSDDGGAINSDDNGANYPP